MPEEVIQHLDKRKPAKCVTVTERISECVAQPFSLRIHGGQQQVLKYWTSIPFRGLFGRKEGGKGRREGSWRSRCSRNHPHFNYRAVIYAVFTVASQQWTCIDLRNYKTKNMKHKLSRSTFQRIKSHIARNRIFTSLLVSKVTEIVLR